MTRITLYDPAHRDDLLPLVFARPVASVRCGILTLAEKWRQYFPEATIDFAAPDYLSSSFELYQGGVTTFIDGSVLPNPELVAELRKLSSGQALISARTQVARVGESLEEVHAYDPDAPVTSNQVFVLDEPVQRLTRPADVFTFNGEQIEVDFRTLTAGRTSQPIPAGVTVVGPAKNLFLSPGAVIEPSIIVCEEGPVYLGENAKVLAGSLLRGPLALCRDSLVKMGAKVYNRTTVGPNCKVGGEINNVVFYANSNKGHDGFLGNAVIGEWCNIGADTNASNLKNDYGEVRVWNYPARRFQPTGLQFHGLVMGDHSKAGINTMFNTGTVVGFSANVFGEGFPRPYIPSFSWGGAGGFQTYRLDKALATAERVLVRRGQTLTDDHRRLFQTIYERTEAFR